MRFSPRARFVLTEEVMALGNLQLEAEDFRKKRAPVLEDGQALTYGPEEVERLMVLFAADTIKNLVELARLGAALQDNDERRKVLGQFADLMQSWIPAAARQEKDK